MTQTKEKVDLGIEESLREKIAESLAGLLADTYMLYLKTHKFHWNVTGPRFQELHTMFEGHYNEMALAVDEIAERIRALGVLAPGSYSEFASLSQIEESTEPVNAEEMIRVLTADHEALVRRARAIISIADEASDQVSADLITVRMKTHEKTAWMLKSLLGN